MTPLLLGIMGPTASGKTDLAENLADELDAELINADAFQVYRGMDIGTAKPDDSGRYHLIDIKSPRDGFGVGEFVRLSYELLDKSFKQNHNVVVVGGTGLYIRALFEQYDDLAEAPDPELRQEIANLTLEVALEHLGRLDPIAVQTIDIQNPIRVRRALERAHGPKQRFSANLPPFQKLKLGILPNVIKTESQIEVRTRLMVQNGWIDEVERLLANGFGPDDPGFRAIGYRAIARHVTGEIELEEAIATTIAETKRYAKRQRSWLRSEPNLGLLDPSSDVLAQAKSRIFELVARSELNGETA